MHAADSTPESCPVCGARLPAGTPPVRCPSCLLRLALQREPEPLDVDDEDAPPGSAAPAPADLPAAPGVFADYQLIESIGRGAMGVVFKARQTSLDRLVALKVLDLAGRVPAGAAKRFRAEASAAAALRHPGIVTIHEVGVHHGWHFLAMDLIEGPTLAAVVAGQPLAAGRAAELVAAVADAIQCAHDRGILHRDLKPSNILVDAAGRPHVADFGLAKRMDADADMTMPGQIMGSPNYMSPEQARGERLGPASDVHALGAILYHCLAGRPPFFGQTMADTLHQVIHGEPVALRLQVAGVPRDLETIALKCLEKDPAKRYPDARSLAEELRRFLRREPIQARPISRAGRLWRWGLRRPAVASLTVATVLLVLAVAIGSPIAALRIRAERERAEDNLYAADMHLAQQAIERSSRSQARALLERHRPGPGETDRRGFEWRYLWTRSGSDEQPVLQAPAGERHLVAIPGTNLIAVGNIVWDAGPPARPVCTLPVGSVALAFDATDGSVLARGPDGFTAWTVATWQPRVLLADEVVHAVAFSPDRRWMATGGVQLRLWAHDGGVWTPVASRPRAFKIWHNARTLAFSPDGGLLASGAGESWANRCVLELWSVPALEPLPGVPDAPRDILSLAFSPGGDRLVAGCWNGRLRIWNLNTRAEIETPMRHDGFVNDLLFSSRDPDVLATAASDRTVRLWSLRERRELVAMQGPLGHLWAMTFEDDGRTLLTLEQHGRVARWDATRRRDRDELIAGGPCTALLGFSPDGGMLATIDDTGALRFWDVARRRELSGLAQRIDLDGVLTHDFEIIAPVISRDLQMLALGLTDGRVKLRNLISRETRTWSAHTRAVRNLAFSPDGAALATVAEDGRLKLWRSGDGTLLAENVLPGSLATEDFNVPLDWSPDGRLLAVASANTITLHDPANARVLRRFAADGLIYSLRFSPDGRMLVSGQEDFELNVWDPRTGALTAEIPTSHQEGVYDLCFAPDGRTLATVVDQVKLWSLATRQEVSTLRGHQRNIFSALFSPDGDVLVTADYGGSVRLWPARPLAAIDAGR